MQPSRLLGTRKRGDVESFVDMHYLSYTCTAPPRKSVIPRSISPAHSPSPEVDELLQHLSQPQLLGRAVHHRDHVDVDRTL